MDKGKSLLVEFRVRWSLNSTMGRIYQYLSSEQRVHSRQDEIERALKAFWLPHAIWEDASDITSDQQEAALNAAIALETQAKLIRAKYQLSDPEVSVTTPPRLNGAAFSAIARAPEIETINGNNGTHLGANRAVVTRVGAIELGGDDYLFDDGDD